MIPSLTRSFLIDRKEKKKPLRLLLLLKKRMAKAKLNMIIPNQYLRS